MSFYPVFGGGFPYKNRLQNKVGSFILTSLLEDLALGGEGRSSLAFGCNSSLWSSFGGQPLEVWPSDLSRVDGNPTFSMATTAVRLWAYWMGPFHRRRGLKLGIGSTAHCWRRLGPVDALSEDSNMESRTAKA